MSGNGLDVIRDGVSDLSAKVPIELCIVTTEKVRRFLVVILSQVVEESRSHMFMVRARTHTREHHGS